MGWVRHVRHWPDWATLLVFFAVAAVAGALVGAFLVWLWPGVPHVVLAAVAAMTSPLFLAVTNYADELAEWFAENVWERIR